jgi:hypothetical protein
MLCVLFWVVKNVLDFLLTNGLLIMLGVCGVSFLFGLIKVLRDKYNRRRGNNTLLLLIQHALLFGGCAWIYHMALGKLGAPVTGSFAQMALDFLPYGIFTLAAGLVCGVLGGISRSGALRWSAGFHVAITGLYLLILLPTYDVTNYHFADSNMIMRFLCILVWYLLDTVYTLVGFGLFRLTSRVGRLISLRD